MPNHQKKGGTLVTRRSSRAPVGAPLADAPLSPSRSSRGKGHAQARPLHQNHPFSEASRTPESKLRVLRGALRRTGGIAIAFSGGVDSTFLAAVAKQELGDKVLAVTATSPTYPPAELREAIKLAKELHLKHELVDSNELKIPGFAHNPENRCYFCKKELFERVGKIAEKHGINLLADGSNTDDLKDYRPGRKALKERGVISPLLDAGLNKSDIRILSREMGLPTAGKPAFACLASRFPYGSLITEGKLKAVDAIETELRKMGFSQVRVRHHGNVARIELLPVEIALLVKPGSRERIVKAGKKAGFLYIALDLQGYRTGAMNEEILGKK